MPELEAFSSEEGIVPDCGSVDGGGYLCTAEVLMLLRTTSELAFQEMVGARKEIFQCPDVRLEMLGIYPDPGMHR